MILLFWRGRSGIMMSRLGGNNLRGETWSGSTSPRGGRSGAQSWAVNRWAPAGLWGDSVKSTEGTESWPASGQIGSHRRSDLLFYMSVSTHFHLVHAALTPKIQSFGRISPFKTWAGRFKKGTTVFFPCLLISREFYLSFYFGLFIVIIYFKSTNSHSSTGLFSFVLFLEFKLKVLFAFNLLHFSQS